jgi:polyadenylate-binding protein 2
MASEVTDQQGPEGEVDFEESYGEGAGDEGNPAGAGDTELAELQQMLEEMEENQTKISAASSAAAAQASTAVAAKSKAEEDRAARDERSVFVGNVDFSTTGEELMGYFSSCGTIERVTILSDKFGTPKG